MKVALGNARLTVPLIDFQQTMRLQIKMRYRLVKFALPWPR